MIIPDPRYPDRSGPTDPGRLDPGRLDPGRLHPGTGSDTGGAHVAQPGGPTPGASAPGPSAPGPSPSDPPPAGPPPSDPRPGGERAPASTDRPFPEPEGPRTTGAGGHVLGVLVGLVLTAVALLVLALGMSRILAGGFGAEDVAPDALGIALVTVGSVLVALVALLAIRTSAVPFTGGLVALLVGAAYLFAPEAAHRETVRLLATEQNRDAVLNTSTLATSGTFFTLGLVLLAAGNAASIVRRRGIEVGAFRERKAARAARER